MSTISPILLQSYICVLLKVPVICVYLLLISVLMAAVFKTRSWIILIQMLTVSGLSIGFVRQVACLHVRAGETWVSCTEVCYNRAGIGPTNNLILPQ